jgi:hypothetical protein
VSEIEELLVELRGIPGARPVSAGEFGELLVRVKRAAGRWADVLDEVRESARTFAGSGTAAAVEVAFRKAEESYVELEIAHRDCAEASGGRGRKPGTLPPAGGGA